MSPHIGFFEILALAVVALAVLGPRDLPVLMRKFGRWTALARSMADEFRSGLEEIGREAELEEVKKEMASVTQSVSAIANAAADEAHAAAPQTDEPHTPAQPSSPVQPSDSSDDKKSQSPDTVVPDVQP